MVLAFKAAVIVILVMFVVGVLGFLIDRSQDPRKGEFGDGDRIP